MDQFQVLRARWSGRSVIPLLCLQILVGLLTPASSFPFSLIFTLLARSPSFHTEFSSGYPGYP